MPAHPAFFRHIARARMHEAGAAVAKNAAARSQLRAAARRELEGARGDGRPRGDPPTAGLAASAGRARPQAEEAARSASHGSHVRRDRGPRAVKFKRKYIRDLIMNFFDHAPRLSDKQLLFAMHTIVPHAGPEMILKNRRELTRRGNLFRSNCVKREANGRLVNLYEKTGGPKRLDARTPF